MLCPEREGDFAQGMKLVMNPWNRKGYRLPSGAEWQYSCCAGAVTLYSFGESWELLEKYGWYTKNSPTRPQPVGSLKPNELGLFDHHGNAWEWCVDIQDRHRKPGEKESDSALSNADERLDGIGSLRGGMFVGRPMDLRSANRSNWFAMSSCSPEVGFRPSRTYP